MNFILEKLITVGLLPIVMLIIGWLSSKYLKPWLFEDSKRLARAKEISLVADRITDELIVMFPNSEWDDLLDKAVDRIIESLDISAEIAKREMSSQLSKKIS